MKEEVRRHGVVVVLYFLLVMLLRWFWTVDLVWMWLGGLVGYGLVFLDRLVYVYLLHPHEQLSQQVQYVIKQKRYKEAIELIHRRRREQTRLAFRSMLFLIAWAPLAFFALTSTGELGAGALVMGVGLHLLYDLWRDQRSDAVMLNGKLFWQLKREVSQSEQKLFLYGFSLVFGLLTIVLI